MSRTEQILIRIFTGALVGLSIFILVGLFFWFYPRQIIDISIDPVNKSVQPGEKLLTENTFTRYANADSSYTSVLVCGSLRYFLLEIKAPTQPSATQTSVFEYTIPAIVKPAEDCFIEVRSQHKVEILPLLTRTYTDRFTSNHFEVKE